MGLTNFPNGITSFGVPVMGSGADVPFTTGNYFFVDSGHANAADSASNGGDPSKPLATLDYAIGRCTASNGDVIILAPGHTEDIDGASAITVDVAGISIIGLGNGANRPTFTWSATAGTIVVSAANVTIKNILTTASIDEVVSMISVTGANCTLDTIDFVPFGALGATGQVRQFLSVGAAANYCTLMNSTHYQYTAGGAAQVWITTAASTGLKVVNNVAMITANASTSSHWIGSSAAPTQVFIAGNKVLFLGGTVTGVITLTTAATGIICGNYLASGTAVSAATAIVADAAYVFENYWIDDAAASAILTPTAGTD